MRTLKLLLLLVSLPCMAETYLCTSENETGYFYSGKTEKWEQGIFKGNQFLLKPLEKEDKKGGEEYGVYETNEGTLIFRCQYWFPEIGMAHCGNKNDYHFKFARKSKNKGTFISADLGVQFLAGNTAAAPRVGIGECIKL
ncbi:hypothetical protein [Microbulbifer sp. PSTR4-B]|uniref:hypothetical protein n=1 Tax=Microbulbifer sp. PSTR4-B TaxID=3243396 RepID=UPI00403A1BEB